MEYDKASMLDVKVKVARGAPQA